MKCPVCGNEYKRFTRHILKSTEINHLKFLAAQEKLIIELFYNYDFYSKCNFLDFNIYINYDQCVKIWKKQFGKDNYKKRINKINSLHVSKALSEKKFSDKHKNNLKQAHLGQIPWNKGLTRKTSDIVNKYSEKRNETMSNILKNKYNSKEMIPWLKGKSKEINPELIPMYEKISYTMSQKKQTNSRGIACIRKDIGHFAASTYEANIYRIFQYENKKYRKEYDCIFPIKYDNGEIHNYRIDIQDIDGLFGIKNAFIEIKGFMDEKSKLKIELFRQQYPQYTLLVIGNSDQRQQYKWEADIEYLTLEKKYKNIIPLWEDKYCNAKLYPDLYNDEKWIVGKKEEKRMHQKLLIMDNGFKFKIGYLWKKQPFNQRPTYGEYNKFVKIFKAVDINNNIIAKNENWGAILSLTQQYIKNNANDYFFNYLNKITIQGYCKSDDIWFNIVDFNVLKNKWY